MGLGVMEATGKSISWLTAAPNEIAWDRSVACGELKGSVGGRFHIRPRRVTCASGRCGGMTRAL